MDVKQPAQYHILALAQPGSGPLVDTALLLHAECLQIVQNKARASHPPWAAQREGLGSQTLSEDGLKILPHQPTSILNSALEKCH